jgi:AraC-like DNA-binding protein/mannose-6-phosphate isomerase-like protein (cupin superfamily)
VSPTASNSKLADPMSDFQGSGQNATKPSNCVGIWRPREFNSIELQHGSEVTVEYPRHWHDEFYLSATLGGASYLDCSRTSFSVTPGQLVMVPPGEVHANRKLGCTSRTMFLEFKALQDVVEQFVERSIPALDFLPGLIDDKRTAKAFLQLHRSLEGARFELEQENSLFLFLCQLVTCHSAAQVPLSREGNEDFAVQRAKLFLEEHYADRVSIHDLARLTRLSAYHFNRSFCQKVGMPPHAYQLQLRIAQAKRFLRLGRSVSETACLTGFYDQSHFVHCFKRSEGVTPYQYVRLSKNLQDGKMHTYYFGLDPSR